MPGGARGTWRAGCRRVALLVAVVCATAASQAAAEIAYQVTFTGLDGLPEIAGTVEGVSRLATETERPPATLRQLRRRIADDVPRLTEVLRSYGYYAASVETSLDAQQAPALVTVSVQPGPPYTLTSYRVAAQGGTGGPVVNLPLAELGLATGGPALAAPIAAADTLLVRALTESGYPRARVTDREVVVDHDRAAVDVTVAVDLGHAARFGPTEIVGLESVDAGFAARRIQWRMGEAYDARKVDQTRDAMRATQLFTSVRIDAGEPADGEDAVPMTVTVVERAPRSVGAGAGYSTSEGLRGKLFWEHRNLFGEGERLRTTATLAEIVTSLSGQFTKPDFLLPRQDLLLDGAIEQERTDAFETERISASGRVRRPLFRRINVSGGLALAREFEEDDNIKRQFTLVSLPVALDVDTSDDRLDPSRGSRGRLTVSPTLQALGSDLSFVRLEIAESRYLSLTGDGAVVLAGRYRLGSVVGVETGELPATQRFFGGGGGSVRAYKFQSLGPRDGFNEPFGGRSIFEVGAELRWRVWGDFGVVPFIEGGQVYDDPAPDLDIDLQWGAGLGLRYFTAVGPLRLDVAVPINPRKNIDDSVEFYVSLGQAF